MKFPAYLSLAAAAVSAASIDKRCSPAYDPEWYGSTYRTPCWLTINTACWTFFPSTRELELDVESRTAVVKYITDSCVELIVEEQTREKDGRKVWGWSASEGKMEVKSDNTLVLTEMSDAALTRYQRYVDEA